MSLYEDYKRSEPWDKDLPADLIFSIKYLRDVFDDHHESYGQLTEKLCYYRLHPDKPDDIKDYLPLLQQLKRIDGVPATQRYIDLPKTVTPPEIFKAFFDLYMGGLTASALAIFSEFVDVGEANKSQLGVPHLKWAEAQTKNMIRSKMPLIELWVRDVCDKQPYAPDENDEELIHWRKWQAPMLIIMKPSGNSPYDSARNWERLDAGKSRRILEALAERYVLHIEGRLEKEVGQLALKLAKQPKPALIPASEAPSPEEQLPKVEAQPRRANMTPRETRKKATQAKYKSWQREFRSLREVHPGRSDVWLSRKIAQMPIAKGSSPETIRKHMKRK